MSDTIAPLMRASDVANAAGLCVPTIHRYVREGKLAAVHPGGGRTVRFEPGVVDEFLVSRGLRQIMNKESEPTKARRIVEEYTVVQRGGDRDEVAAAISKVAESLQALALAIKGTSS